MIEIARDSRLTVIGDRSRDCCDFQADRDWGQLWTPGLPGMGTTRSGFQADHHKIQKTTQNKENGRDLPETIQNQTKGSESSRDQHKIHKTTQNGETDRDQPKTIQNQTKRSESSESSRCGFCRALAAQSLFELCIWAQGGSRAARQQGSRAARRLTVTGDSPGFQAYCD